MDWKERFGEYRFDRLWLRCAVFPVAVPLYFDRVAVGGLPSERSSDLAHASGYAYRVLGEQDAAISRDLLDANTLLVTAPPCRHGDPYLGRPIVGIIGASNLRWIGYVSRATFRQKADWSWPTEAQAAAESQWRSIGLDTKPLQLLHPGIVYGPGCNALDTVINESGRSETVRDTLRSQGFTSKISAASFSYRSPAPAMALPMRSLTASRQANAICSNMRRGWRPIQSTRKQQAYLRARHRRQRPASRHIGLAFPSSIHPIARA